MVKQMYFKKEIMFFFSRHDGNSTVHIHGKKETEDPEHFLCLPQTVKMTMVNSKHLFQTMVKSISQVGKSFC